MKKQNILRILITVILFLCLKTIVLAQPIGSNMYNPVNVGSLNVGNSYNDTKSNSTTNGFGNNIGQPSDDIFYKFTLPVAAKVNLSHCASGFDTYMHLLDVNGNTIASNDDNGPLCSGLKSSISISLAAGTYFLVSEGYGSNSGNITTTIAMSTQNNSNLSYTETVDSLFQHLDKTGASTGILYDRVLPIASLQDFNFSNSDTSSHWHFIQSYSEIIRATYNPSNTWLTVNDLKDLATSAKIESKIAIGLGNYQFNVIDSNAISNGLIQMIDSMYYDVPGRSNHPYLSIHSFIASPLVDSVKTLSVKYDFSSNYVINIGNIALNSLQVDFGDGNGLINVALNDSISINYTSSGYKYLKFIANFSDNSSIITYGTVKVIGEPQVYLKANSTLTTLCSSPNTQLKFWSDLTFQGYDETTATKGYGEATIYYATNGSCDGVIRKPIIVVDGFDPGDKQDADKLYKTYLDRDIPGTPSFATSLRANGHDIIVLNFPEYKVGTRLSNGRIIPVSRDGGADFIERNARVLMTLINKINTLKEGNEKLIIIGPSMGGLISRYALTYMEQVLNTPHQTKLWISFDSPHQGANIPIGDQWFLDYYARNTGSEELIANRDDKISSIAAKQMLVHHFLSNSEAPAGAPNFRNQFLTTINNLGFPEGDVGTQFRKIALIDGSLGGTETNSPEQKAFTFDIRRRKSIGFLGIRWRTWTAGSAKMYFTPSYGNTSKTVLESSMIGNSSSNYKASNPPNSSGYDVAPGGTYNTQGILYDEGNKSVSSLLLNFAFDFEARFYSVVRDHSFINTKSALAFSGSNQNLSENVSARNLVCTLETPFDSYFGSFNTNREHVELWSEAVDWITEEINGNPQLPSVNTYGYNGEIVGNSSVCSNTTFNLINSPNVAVTWSVSNGLSIVSSTNNSIEVTRNTAVNDPNSSIEATLGGCYSTSQPIKKFVTTNIDVNQILYAVLEPTSLDYGGIICKDRTTKIQVTSNGQDISNIYFQWGSDTPGWGVGTLDTYGQLIDIYPPSGNVGNSPASFYAEFGSDECGSMGYYFFTVNVTNCLGGFNRAVSNFQLYPNPANNEVNIVSEDLEKNPTILKQINLLNSQGIIVKSTSIKSGENSTILETKEIPNGTYYLHLIEGKETIKKQIIIQH
ncbi:T9SS type A sorting domain-containing protein [Pedobacter alpinus]|uniref:T9SS type A sorting domain-containing protein n=1 Tax=Pedobacter alpinus TaxID=1590643 RepID=A0ABW5TV07_9SPHI